jgi:hypothetical protein
MAQRAPDIAPPPAPAPSDAPGSFAALAKACENAPCDDEPETDEERAAVAEAWEDVRAGRMHTMADVMAELGLTERDLSEGRDKR